MKYPQDYINKIIQGDCLKIMKGIPDKSVDLVLTDPPYGIGIASSSEVGGGSHRGKPTQHEESDWDKQIPTKEYFDEIFRISKNQIIFGGNYMIENLYPTACYLIWDKREGLPERTFADCELAWTSFNSPARIFRYKWDGMIQENMKDKDVRFHPTTKPIELMRWCLKKHSEKDQTILDPFLGSGTTAVACKQLNRNFIGIEISEKYCEIARRRLEQKQLF